MSLLIKNDGIIFRQIYEFVVKLNPCLRSLSQAILVEEKLLTILRCFAMINDAECDTIKYVIGKVFSRWLAGLRLLAARSVYL